MGARFFTGQFEKMGSGLVNAAKGMHKSSDPNMVRSGQRMDFVGQWLKSTSQTYQDYAAAKSEIVTGYKAGTLTGNDFMRMSVVGAYCLGAFSVGLIGGRGQMNAFPSIEDVESHGHEEH
jgi:hypothetical protein